MKDRFYSVEESLHKTNNINSDSCWVVLGPRKAFDRIFEYFRNRVIGVLREMPSLSDPENAHILVATMNGLTDEAWVSGCCLR